MASAELRRVGDKSVCSLEDSSARSSSHEGFPSILIDHRGWQGEIQVNVPRLCM